MKKEDLKQRPARKKPKKITETYLHNAGLAYLQKFAAGSGKFRSVMIRKVRRSCMHHPEQDFDICAAFVNELVKKFERSGLLNDRIYAEGAIASLRRAGKSKKAILMKMAEKEIDKTLALEILTTLDDRAEDDAETTAAFTFVKRKKLAARDKDKALAAMARAGFSYDISRKTLEKNK